METLFKNATRQVCPPSFHVRTYPDRKIDSDAARPRITVLTTVSAVEDSALGTGCSGVASTVISFDAQANHRGGADRSLGLGN
jgi:hypothetical protein